MVEPSWLGLVLQDYMAHKTENTCYVVLVMWGYKKVAVNKPGRGPSPEHNHARTLILDFQPPELWEINVCCLSPHPPRYLLQQPELTHLSHPGGVPPASKLQYYMAVLFTKPTRITRDISQIEILCTQRHILCTHKMAYLYPLTAWTPTVSHLHLGSSSQKE